MVGSSKPMIDPSRLPALLTLPEDLWNDPSLVLNGTSSMVFKGDSDVISEHSKRFQSTEIEWGSFLKSTLDYLRNNVYDGVENSKSEKRKRSFYLKKGFEDTSLWKRRSARFQRISVISYMLYDRMELTMWESFS